MFLPPSDTTLSSQAATVLAEYSSETSEGNTVLSADHLSKSFGGNVILDGVAFRLQRGEVVLLRGDNGSGKTTLLNILTGNIEPDQGAIHVRTSRSDQIFEFGTPTGGRSWRRTRFSPEKLAHCGVGRSWQDTRLFATLSLCDNISVAKPGQLGEQPWWAITRPRAVGRQESQIRAETGKILSRLGLADRVRSSADKISLGQGKRVAIARAVNAGAEILLLDEPLAGLDTMGIYEVLTLINELIRNHGLTVVIVEHVFNIPRVLELATTVWTLDKGRLRSEPASALRNRLRGAGALTTAEVDYWVRELSAGRMVQSDSLEAGATLTVISGPAPNAEEVLAVRELVVRRGRREVIGRSGKSSGLSFALRRGDIGILASPNGWGKTTLLEAIAGLLPVHEGSIALLGEKIEQLPVWERVSRGLALCRARDQGFPELTVHETLRLSDVGAIPSAIHSLLERHVVQLSGGERQRMALACTLNRASYTPLLLLDEPFSALDQAGVQVVCDALVSNQDGAAVLIAVPATLKEVSL